MALCLPAVLVGPRDVVRKPHGDAGGVDQEDWMVLRL